MDEKMKLIIDKKTFIDTGPEKELEILHKAVLKIQETIPEEYATSSTFSMVSDAIVAGSSVFFVSNPPEIKGKYPKIKPTVNEETW